MIHLSVEKLIVLQNFDMKKIKKIKRVNKIYIA